MTSIRRGDAMTPNDIVLYILLPVMLVMAGIIGYFYQRDQKKVDANVEKLNLIGDAVTTLMAKQEGQLSFAKALMDSQAEQVLLHKDVSKIHERLDGLYEYIRRYVDERIKHHEADDHSQVS